jgi:hypothetical protein
LRIGAATGGNEQPLGPNVPLQLPPLPGLPVPLPMPTPQPTPQLQQLIPNELLDRINKYAFANAPPGTVPAPPCVNQGPYDYAGETTQYPHVKEGAGR